jgi:hypothetical protein
VVVRIGDCGGRPSMPSVARGPDCRGGKERVCSYLVRVPAQYVQCSTGTGTVSFCAMQMVISVGAGLQALQCVNVQLQTFP